MSYPWSVLMPNICAADHCLRNTTNLYYYSRRCAFIGRIRDLRGRANHLIIVTSGELIDGDGERLGLLFAASQFKMSFPVADCFLFANFHYRAFHRLTVFINHLSQNDELADVETGYTAGLESFIAVVDCAASGRAPPERS